MRGLGEWTSGIRLLVGLSPGQRRKLCLQPLVQGVSQLKESVNLNSRIKTKNSLGVKIVFYYLLDSTFSKTTTWLRVV